jgi:GH18 family chitinase
MIRTTYLIYFFSFCFKAEMLKDESSRKKFVDDSVTFLQKFEFDGLDLDFECK